MDAKETMNNQVVRISERFIKKALCPLSTKKFKESEQRNLNRKKKSPLRKGKGPLNRLKSRGLGAFEERGNLIRM